MGALVKKKRNNATPTKCVYLGAWILGTARVWMSRIMRLVDGYTQPSHMFYYTDTDSYKVHNSTYQLLCKQDGVIGKDLGQMADELDGGKIIRAIFLAPKTYICEYISSPNAETLGLNAHSPLSIAPARSTSGSTPPNEARL